MIAVSGNRSTMWPDGRTGSFVMPTAGGIAFVSMILVSLLFMASPLAAQTAEVRGRIDRGTLTGVYPASYVRVTLISPTMQRSSTFTDRNGVYYFFRVPPGSYRLEVEAPWGFRGTFSVQVQPRPRSDIPAIQIR